MLVACRTAQMSRRRERNCKVESRRNAWTAPGAHLKLPPCGLPLTGRIAAILPGGAWTSAHAWQLLALRTTPYERGQRLLSMRASRVRNGRGAVTL